MKTPLAALTIAVLQFACHLQGVAQEPAKADVKSAAQPATLASLSWMTGRWRGAAPNILIEEH